MNTSASESLPMGNVNKISKMFGGVSKKPENNLLLSTTYELNNSGTKKIAVGLGLQSDGEFQPVIKLLNNSSSTGIILKISAWNLLNNANDLVSDYFKFDVDDGSQWPFDLLELGECDLIFTIAHGARAIRFEPPNKPTRFEPGQAADDENARDCKYEFSQPAPKRRKLYIPTIVMQDTTFEGLKSVAVCVDERVRRLERIVHDVNKCKKQLVEYLARKVETLVPDDTAIRTAAEISLKAPDSLKEIIAPMGDAGPIFRENYYDIFILEISRLFLSHVTSQVKQLVKALPH